MKRTRFSKRVWPLLVLSTWILPLSSGCVPLQRQDLTAFVEELLRNAAVAFLL